MSNSFVAFTGSSVCTTAAILNFAVFYIYLCRHQNGKKLELKLFLIRIFLDAVVSFLASIIYTSYVYRIFTSSDASPPIFYTAAISSTFVGVRDFLSMIISLERFVATQTPMFFRRHSNHFSNTVTLVILISYWAIELFRFFGICEVSFSKWSPAAFFYSLNACSIAYVYIVRSFFGVITFFLCLTLCHHLVLESAKSSSSSSTSTKSNLSRITQISMADGFAALIFESGPYIVLFFELIDSKNFGQLMAVHRIFGKLLQALLVIFLMMQDKQPKVTRIGSNLESNVGTTKVSKNTVSVIKLDA